MPLIQLGWQPFYLWDKGPKASIMLIYKGLTVGETSSFEHIVQQMHASKIPNPSAVASYMT